MSLSTGINRPVRRYYRAINLRTLRAISRWATGTLARRLVRACDFRGSGRVRHCTGRTLEVPVDGQTAPAQETTAPGGGTSRGRRLCLPQMGASRQAKARQSDREQGCRQTLHCAVSLTQSPSFAKLPVGARLTDFQLAACRRRNQLRSASRRALKRSAHFLEQSAVR